MAFFHLHTDDSVSKEFYVCFRTFLFLFPIPFSQEFDFCFSSLFFLYLFETDFISKQKIHESCGGNCIFFQYTFEEMKKGAQQLLLCLRHRSLWEEKEGN